MMVHPILMGLVPAGAKVPPSPSMAAALGLSHNTVSLALQVLVDQGFLISSSRMERQRNTMKPANWQDYAYPASYLPEGPLRNHLGQIVISSVRGSPLLPRTLAVALPGGRGRLGGCVPAGGGGARTSPPGLARRGATLVVTS